MSVLFWRLFSLWLLKIPDLDWFCHRVQMDRRSSASHSWSVPRSACTCVPRSLSTLEMERPSSDSTRSPATRWGLVHYFIYIQHGVNFEIHLHAICIGMLMYILCTYKLSEHGVGFVMLKSGRALTLSIFLTAHLN